MGVAFKDIVISREISQDKLKDEIIIIDGNNILYQFLTTIRARDGTLLTDSKGNVTSHLVGLFTRTTNLIQRGIKLAFVFDGKAPELKQKERQKRSELKAEAEKKFLEAKENADIENMKKYAARTTRLSKDMISSAKELLSTLGIPIVQAPSEGEAQASFMVKNKDAFAVGSQDYDSLVHGATRLVRNLSIAGKRKKGKSLAYEIVKPEMLELAENLNTLGIDQNQLIALAMIIGTDYNPGGIKGIGPKNALKLIKRYKSDFDGLFEEAKWNENFDISWEEVYYLIKKIPVERSYKLEWKEAQKDKIIHLLVDKHNFSFERVENSLDKIYKEVSKKRQKSLHDF